MDELFRYFDEFYSLNRASREAVKEICSEIQVSKNELLQPFGHTCKTIYYIKTGSAGNIYRWTYFFIRTYNPNPDEKCKDYCVK